jgi:organic hydroperoxide reductase OsmC/OhrA
MQVIEVRLSIIARLRVADNLCKAADNLCEAAKATNGFIELCGNTTERLAKAIADYEKKEKK